MASHPPPGLHSGMGFPPVLTVCSADIPQACTQMYPKRIGKTITTIAPHAAYTGR